MSRLFLAAIAVCLLIAAAISLRAWRDPLDAPVLDIYGRLTHYPGKVPIPCPDQNARTAVIFVVGQSNVANQAEALQATAFGDKVLNFFDGACTIAGSPLLGSTGVGGESLTPMADNLIRSGRYDRVVLAPFAVSGSPITRFVSDDLVTPMRIALDNLLHRYKPTHAVWHQGESDGATKAEDYRKDFRTILSRWRTQGMAAPVFVSVTTRCKQLNPGWQAGNPVSEVQLTLPDAAAGIFAGPDADALIPVEERMDRECHLNAAGQAHLARLLATALLAVDAKP